jgi:predicted nucleic acid-binding protein
MSVIVDTPVWSSALRRSHGSVTAEASELAALIREGRAILLGPVRQELLSRIRSPGTFKALRASLLAFPEFRLRARDYEEAADCYNRCRAKGIQGSNTDFLLCAAALERGLPVYSTDRDFDRYAKVLRVKLHAARD